MKLKTDRDFTAEKLYSIVELDFTLLCKKLSKDLSEASKILDDSSKDDVERNYYTMDEAASCYLDNSTKIVTYNEILNALHVGDYSLEQFELMMDINKRKKSIIQVVENLANEMGFVVCKMTTEQIVGLIKTMLSSYKFTKADVTDD